MKISYSNFALKAGVIKVVLMPALFLFFAFNAPAQTAPLRGSVVMKKADGTTLPVEGALIDVGRVDVAAQYPSAKTSRKGEFAFAGMPLGAVFWLTVSAPGAKAEVIPNIKAGMENIQITLSPGDGRRYTSSEIREMLKGTSEQKKTPDMTSQEKRNTDGFMGIKYGTSVAEARKIIAAGKLGEIQENVSYPGRIYIEGADTDYIYDRSVASRNLTKHFGIDLSFVDDKFYQAKISYWMDKDLYLRLYKESEGEKDPLDFDAIKKDFDRLYYEAKIYQPSTSEKNGKAIWEFKQPTGKSNFIALHQKDNQLILTFQNDELFKLSVQRDQEEKKARESAKAKFDAAENYRREKKYDLAVVEYTGSIEFYSDQRDAYHWRGHSYFELGKYELAVADFTKALTYRLATYDLLNDRAAAYAFWSKDKYGLALADLMEAINFAPNEARAYMLRAKIFCSMGKKDLAAADEKEAIKRGGTVTQKCEQ